MYYHVILETDDKIGKNNNYQVLYDFNITELEKLKKEVLNPFKENIKFQFKGYFIQPNRIRRLAIKQSEKSVEAICSIEQQKVGRGIFYVWTNEMVVNSDKLTKDVTTELLNSVPDLINTIQTENNSRNTKIFIVHGHDDALKLEVARFIEKFKLEAIILHEKANSGMTIIEKIEKYTDVNFAIVLYSPCDIGTQNDGKSELKLRARQNVVFEHGYLIGRLGREKVCALVKDDIETPGDISGVVYIDYNKQDWKLNIAKELKTSG
ncbi:DNA-binding protein [Leptospira noumeaensis]|uniref:DNA-binding protein n=1 Tax=Leptospira noumeaensis TaxID=2484964 RepID=A0A4R9I059_9LEPT|nr:nucleotide-binding protein [Leptospira noumeaensis]TGK78653.1 DNA-binding protein [Leptospira noumeaensis]